MKRLSVCVRSLATRADQHHETEQRPGAAFNAPSRALIVQRLLKAAGESYSFNAFLTKDVIPPTTKGTAYFGSGEESHTPPFLDGPPDRLVEIRIARPDVHP